VGIFVQAITTNLTAILFIPLLSLYDLSYVHLGLLVGVNFATQVAVDIIFSGWIDRLGYKRLLLPAGIFALIGLVLFGLSPALFANPLTGFFISTVIFAASSGLLEILLSPIVNAIPNTEKGPAMSLMHSFYAWGQVATIIITTLYLAAFGIQHWQGIVFFWAVVPLVNFLMFLGAPFPPAVPEEHRLNMRDLIFKPFYLLALGAIFFGAATELVMNQWASTFFEKVIRLPKVTGDLLGMCGFAVMLGLGRVLFGAYGARVNLNRVLILSCALAVGCYVIVAVSPVNALALLACTLCGLAASLLWPGTLVITAEKYPMAGAWMFAILAAAGDIGASIGPFLTGLVTDRVLGSGPLASFAAGLGLAPEQFAIRAGILTAAVFPALALVCHAALKGKKIP
jgi:MFS family permease